MPRRALILYAHIKSFGVGKECAAAGRATGRVASHYKSAIRIAPTTRMKIPTKLSAPDAEPVSAYPKSVGTSIIKPIAPMPHMISHKNA